GGSKFTAAGANVTYACNGQDGKNGTDGKHGTSITDVGQLNGLGCTGTDGSPGTISVHTSTTNDVTLHCDVASKCPSSLPSYANSTTTCDAATGTIGLTCDTGFADANGQIADGCELDLRSDPNNCGAVGNVI